MLMATVATYGCDNINNRSQQLSSDALANHSNAGQIDTVSDSLSNKEGPAPKPQKDRYGFVKDSLNVIDSRVEWGDSFYELLIPYTTPRNIDYLARATRDEFNVNRIEHGDRYRIYTAGQGDTLVGWVHHYDRLNYNVIQLRDDTVRAFTGRKSIDTLTHTARGKIRTSLYHTVRRQNLPQELVMKLAEIYAWEIDFFALRKGDRFKAVYEELKVDGKHYRYGEVVAAEFEHRDEAYEAYRFYYDGKQEGGYYDEEGQSLQKALLKAPLQYSRVSSGFSHSRMHPILHRRMPHRGIDYAAPSGTPVVSVGDGEVIEANYRGANGNIVKIRHNSTYTSFYLHLRGFAKGVYRGATVEQGQTIGYVGSTGRSTGPHLDYRVYKYGNPVDPMDINPPSTDGVPDSLFYKYETIKDSMKRRLQNIREQDGVS